MFGRTIVRMNSNNVDLHVIIKKEQKDLIEAFAYHSGQSVSEVIRRAISLLNAKDYIKQDK